MSFAPVAEHRTIEILSSMMLYEQLNRSDEDQRAMVGNATKRVSVKNSRL